jgi:elongin-C
MGGSRLIQASGSFSEAITGRCHLENINGVVLQKVVEYFYYNEKHRDSIGVADMEIPPELCLELVMAADYLDT